MVVAAFPLLIIGAIYSRVARVLRWNPLAYLGKISYSVYMIHFPLQLLIHTAAVTNFLVVDLGKPWALLMFFALTIVSAALLHRWVELPGRRLIMEAVEGRRAVADK
jgi:peptidoglycan/LPS O-acetylase OafA/YrhL